MTHSDTIGTLAEALSKAQRTMKNAVKDSSNPFFKSKYADLASVSDACREELSANGLAVVQLPTMRDGKMVLEYMLMHSSGEFIGSELEMTPVKSDPQGIGSAITYARRYTLAAITGVATEDDDGNAASATTKKSSAARTTEDIDISGQTKQAESQEGNLSVPPAAAVPGEGCISVGEAANFHRMFRDSLKPEKRKLAEELVHAWLRVQGIVDADGKPSALAIKKASFYDVREAAVQHARSLINYENGAAVHVP